MTDTAAPGKSDRAHHPTRLYLSGRMTGLPDLGFPTFNAAADKLRAVGYTVVNPAEKGIIDGWEWEDYLRYDIKCVADVDGIATLPGWELSRGAQLEVHIGRALDMIVRPVDDFLILPPEAVLWGWR